MIPNLKYYKIEETESFDNDSIPILEMTKPLEFTSGFLCRDGGIRTHGLADPNGARYRTAPHPDAERL
jgi:hypothetical protein